MTPVNSVAKSTGCLDSMHLGLNTLSTCQLALPGRGRKQLRLSPEFTGTCLRPQRGISRQHLRRHPCTGTRSALFEEVIPALDPGSLPSLASPVLSSIANPSALLDASADLQSGFASSFLLVLFSEIGDKTFFIAALLASRRPALEVFTGTFGALGAMTVVSVLLGRALHVLDELVPVRLGSVDIPVDDVAATILLVYFGLSTLRDAFSMDPAAGALEEEQEAAKALESLPFASAASTPQDTGAGDSSSAPTAGRSASEQDGRPAAGAAVAGPAFSLPLLASVFTLVFLAEWGDKSFFSTIALAAASSPVGVVFGSVAAHGLATIIAVVGGSLLSQYVSEQAVAYIGGTLFLVFAGSTLFDIIDKVTGNA